MKTNVRKTIKISRDVNISIGFLRGQLYLFFTSARKGACFRMTKSQFSSFCKKIPAVRAHLQVCETEQPDSPASGSGYTTDD